MTETNHGKPWTQDDEDRIVALLKLDTPLQKIAEDLGRTDGAVVSRMETMAYNLEKFNVAKRILIRG